eukprot:5412673-Heterocapsa_arctica.AAC.1
MERPEVSPWHTVTERCSRVPPTPSGASSSVDGPPARHEPPVGKHGRRPGRQRAYRQGLLR